MAETVCCASLRGLTNRMLGRQAASPVRSGGGREGRTRLLPLVARTNEPHAGSTARFADRLRVAEVVLVPSDERTDELRRDQSRLMPHAGELTHQPMRTRTRFHSHTTGGYLLQRPQ